VRFYILSLNGECRIIHAGRVPLSAINYAAFGIAYGVNFVGCERNLARALITANEAGFTEAIMNGETITLEPVGVAGVA
jgi:hypothetical protein